MHRLAGILCFVAAVAGAESTPDPRQLVAGATRELGFSVERLSGPGAQLLEELASGAQFVLVGESHYDHDTPIFTGALYRMLRQQEGFSVLVVENDRLAMDAVSGSLRGDLDAIAALSSAYPYHVGFTSDQDLALYAHASEVGELWGIEQAQGSIRYLEKLRELAPAPALPLVEELLAKARANETWERPGGFLHDDPEVLGQLRDLQSRFEAGDGSQAARLLHALVVSAEIYSFNRRAGEGEYVGLYNNTWREAWFREQFLEQYRAHAQGAPLKALFKMGGNHVYRGKSPVQAFTIGNFAHEFAFLNGMKAVGISVIAVSGFEWSDIPAWLQPLLPAERPVKPVVINLAPLHPYVRVLGEQAPEGDRWRLRDYLLGHDAIVVLPNSRRATTELVGIPQR